MTNDHDDFRDLILDNPEGKPRTIGLLIRAPCLNSVELEITERSYTDPVLQTATEFVEQEDGPEAGPVPRPEPTAGDEIRADMARIYQRHIAIARSSGPGGTWDAYTALALAEGLTPIRPRY
jgi:hypothetical protein